MILCGMTLATLSRSVQDATTGAAGSESLRQTWRFLDLPPAWVIVLLILPAVAGVSWLAYLKEGLGRGARGTLMTLRFFSICLLLLVLFRPVRVEHQETVLPAEVVILLDDSASMRRQDSYTGDSQLRSALQALGGAPPEELSRSDLARKAIVRDLLPILERGDYQARLLRFSDSVSAIADLSEAQGRGNATHLGDALNQAILSGRGGHVTDVVIVSDGRSNGGLAPLDAGAAAAAAGIPVHTIVVGDTRPERNLIVELVDVPSSVLEGDEVAISVRIVARGITDAGSTQVVLEELLGRNGEESRIVAEESTPLVEGGERVVLVAPPANAGVGRRERRFRVTVPPTEGETLLDDNSLEFSVHLSTEKIRVLFVEGYPRWEYRFLKELLKRADERIVVQCYLMSATPDFPQEASTGADRLERVPTGRRELLDNYDVIILGDISPYQISPDPARGDEFVASLFEFVERGGGLCVIAGEWRNPKTVAGTDFAKLLPVVLDSGGSLGAEWDTRMEFRPALEHPQTPHEIVRLHEDIETNRRLWEGEGGLKGFHWFYPVVKAKPGAQVLLRHPTMEGSSGRYPLLVTGYYPSGRTLFLAVDSTYRWRFQFKDLYHERFWRQAVRWLALGRLRGGDRRYSLEPLRSSYDLDQRVTFEARVLDEDYRPSETDRQAIFVESPDGENEEIQLTRIEGRGGLFRGSYESERPGLYRAWIEVEGERVATTEVEIVLPSRENQDPSPDPQTLAALSSLTGGKALDVARTRELEAEFPGGEERREPISSRLEDAWDNWATLIIALLLLSTEWILRKRLELV